MLKKYLGGFLLLLALFATGISLHPAQKQMSERLVFEPGPAAALKLAAYREGEPNYDYVVSGCYIVSENSGKQITTSCDASWTALAEKKEIEKAFLDSIFCFEEEGGDYRKVPCPAGAKESFIRSFEDEGVCEAFVGLEQSESCPSDRVDEFEILGN